MARRLIRLVERASRRDPSAEAFDVRAWRLNALDGPDSLELVEVADAAPAAGGAVVEVHAIGVNFPDLLATKGQYQNKVELPFVPGCEIAGVVREAPADSGWRSGDRVAAFVWNGGYAELAQVPLPALSRLAEAADFSTGAAMIVNYHTVYFGLVRRGGLRAGETVLVLGAGGGIGSAGVQVAKALDARVIAGIADEAQRATAVEAGADEVVLLEEGFSAQIRGLTGGRGADLALDPLGDWLFVEATRALAPEGRILVIGFAAGEIPTVKVNRLLLKNISAIGVAWGAFLDVDPGLLRDAASVLNVLLESGRLTPSIGARFAFEEIPDALRKLERHEIAGKGVVELRKSLGG